MPARRALGLGLEVAVGAAAAAGGFGALAGLAQAAEAAGYGSVWLRGASGDAIDVDPVAVLGALVERTVSLGLGAACAGGDDRHPAILARDLTTLDILSGGRAALSLGLPGTGADASARLTEAAQICRLLFSPGDGAVSFSGEHFSVRFAPNRPPPEQSDGPPLLVDLGVGAGSAALDDLVTTVDGVVVGGPSDAVAEGRRLVDASARSAGVEGPRLVWRGSLAATVSDGAALVQAVVAAGADAVILAAGRGGAPSARDITEAAARILPVLGRAA
jgi:alkanesulfonate monooxygenase SsuD/methylene tetrahydromethanopterin reductase-like flavin-dependent oxidoreductase (luciferase family)